MSIIDFHSHIIPKIDDGSRSVEMSGEMLVDIKNQGIDTVVATPHFYANRDRINSFLERRQKSFDDIKELGELHSIEVLLGAEVAYFDGISKAEDVKKLTLKDNILLLEMPFDVWSDSIIREVEDLVHRDKFSVIIAHLDRYLKISGNKNYIKKLLKIPLTVQINSGTLLDWKKRKKAFEILKSVPHCVIGSDCHNTTTRKPNLQAGREIILKKLGKDILDKIDQTGNNLLVTGGKFDV